MALDPLQTALWRFERIAPLLDHCLSDTQRSRLIREMSQILVQWPSGRTAPVSRSVLYEWYRRYRTDHQIESLLPSVRTPVDRPGCIKPEWVEYALALMEEQPVRSLFILTGRIQSAFGLAKPPSRSSLYRALSTNKRYIAVCRRQKQPRRTHFVASAIHQIRHGDAKADFVVTFTNGVSKRVRVLSILDDCSRFVLAALVVSSESLPSVCRSFVAAAARFGLPQTFYADRGSPYDAYVFRQGLAMLGVRRIDTKARNPSAHGKIEAYHRSLHRWFIKELAHQPLVDLDHLQQLLNAFIDQIYNRHYHRELKKTPYDAFNNTCSSRQISLERLHEAFLKSSRQKPHPKTGTVRVNGTLWKVPSSYIVPRRPLRIAEDLLDSTRVFLMDGLGKSIRLLPAVRVVSASNTAGSKLLQEYPAGSLSALLQTYRGRVLPQAIGGFGLPEIYKQLALIMGRTVPDTEREAALIADWLKTHGPFQPQAFTAALQTAVNRLGTGRTLTQLLGELKAIIDRTRQKENLP